eukprot:scaffold12506_cov43-Phaeocystis_antarctica.AAC.2
MATAATEPPCSAARRPIAIAYCRATRVTPPTFLRRDVGRWRQRKSRRNNAIPLFEDRKVPALPFPCKQPLRPGHMTVGARGECGDLHFPRLRREKVLGRGQTRRFWCPSGTYRQP